MMATTTIISSDAYNLFTVAFFLPFFFVIFIAMVRRFWFF